MFRRICFLTFDTFKRGDWNDYGLGSFRLTQGGEREEIEGNNKDEKKSHIKTRTKMIFEFDSMSHRPYR